MPSSRTPSPQDTTTESSSTLSALTPAVSGRRDRRRRRSILDLALIPERLSDHTRKKEAEAAKKKDLSEQRWYHGLCSRADVEPLLRNTGDFIVRTTETDGSVRIVLSFLTEHRGVLHLFVHVSTRNLFYLKALRNGRDRRFETVYDLVKYYMKYPIEMRATRQLLVVGVPRPKWLVKSDSITYDKNSTPLGQGNFADVFMGTFVNAGDKNKEKIPVAIKVLKTHDKNEEERKAKQSMIREGKRMSYYTHPNIVQFYGVLCDRPDQVILAIEFCPGGSLENHLFDLKEKLLVAELVTFAIESALGMCYLHSQGCIHRDLAARNCLISSLGVIKISDFGLSCIEGVAERQPSMDCVPIRLMAPETLAKLPIYSTKSDVWAYGVLLYEIFTKGDVPWPEESVKAISRAIRKLDMPEMPGTTPQPIKELVASIWIKNYNDRPTFTKIVLVLHDLRSKECPPPALSDCTVNLISGVKRTEAAEVAIQTEVEQLEGKTIAAEETSTQSTTVTNAPELSSSSLVTSSQSKTT